MEYVALDLETTGLDPERDRVIEVGAVVFTVDSVGATLERLTDPGRSVPDAVLRLTGISPEDLVGAPAAATVMTELAAMLPGRQPVGHGARLDVDFLVAAGLWPREREILDTLDIARILMPSAQSHSLPVLAMELGLAQPRPHRALDDADATRQLFLRLRELVAAQAEPLKDAMLTLVAPYGWALASFFAEALTTASPGLPMPPRRSVAAANGAGLGREGVDDDPDAVFALLAPEGPLAAAMPGYEHREAQLQMLLAVAQIMRRGGRLAVEAGTGTGKSLAYLVPALARAVRRGERVVVSTHTHTLQEQLVLKDIPGLRQWLPWDFEATLLKGRSNYVSLRRWRRYQAEACRDVEELKFKLKILVWLHQTRTGDRAELRLQGPEEGFWARIASDPLDCIGLRCTPDDCFVHRARAEAERADLVVVNHALLLADASTQSALIPPYEHLVVDEAHHLEESATHSLRCDVDGGALEGLLRRLAADGEGRRTGLLAELRLEPRLGDSGDALAEAEAAALATSPLCAELFQTAAEWARRQLPDDQLRREEAVRLVPALREVGGWPELAALAADAVTALSALDALLRRSGSLGREWLGGREPDQDLRELEIIRGRLAEAADLLDQAFQKPDPNRVYWVTLSGRTNSLVVRSAPLEIGTMLRERVFGELGSVVMTSASLAVAGSFDYFCSRVGLGAEVETLLLPSPFDYLHQALVCLPTDVPDPQSEEFEAAVEEIVADVAGRLRGRTLALFTSHQQLRNVYTALKHRSDLDDVLILGQGIDGQRRHVLRAFEENERPLLLGTSSFWEGVDVPGDRLSCVVIVRLPFQVPTEPVFAARAERLRDPFLQYALPQAALRLKQGFGRLIRRHDDRGAVVILDNRVLERDYGRAFLEALPPASRYLGPAEGMGETIEQWVAPLSLPPGGGGSGWGGP
ncbi:MAG TPA: helicase C-terminal domain-containing protein [Candidatus Dormibacteraeota bacterium]|nr:helicase C-terminal domain-containing protein [Candidatus Dormibacteraeota bacterium]